MATWQVQEAKTRLSELITDAQTKGPQIITKHGSKTAVVLSMGEYESLATPETKPEPKKTGKMSLIDFILTAPKFKSDDEEQEFFASLR
jgi:prevent-host-death family protein